MEIKVTSREEKKTAMYLLVFVEESLPGVQEHTCSKHHKLITPRWLLLSHLLITTKCMVLTRTATVGTDDDGARHQVYPFINKPTI